MLTIGPKQTEALRAAAEKYGVRAHAQEIRNQLLKLDANPENKLKSPDALALIITALEAAWRCGIVNTTDQCVWVVIYLVTNQPFWEIPFFRTFLEDPLFHPSTKVRNLAESLKSAGKALQK